MEIQRQKIVLYVKLDPTTDPGPPGLSRDVTDIGHFGTGDLEITLKTMADLEAAKPSIEKAYREIGG
jgi:predicted transport protein